MPERLARRAARIRPDLPLATLDLAIFTAATAAVLLLRFDGTVPPDYWARYLERLPAGLALLLGVNWLWGLYGQIWKHASVLEARRVALAGATCALTLVTLSSLDPRRLPISVVILGAGLSTALLGAVRFQARLFAVQRGADRAGRAGMRVIVLGAGQTGASIVRDMARNPRVGMVPVAILDDDARTHGRSLLGVRVEGPLSMLPELADLLDAHQVVLAISSPSHEVVRAAAAMADRAEIPLRVLPSVAELVRDQVSVRDLRDLRIEDLLGRQEIVTDTDAVRNLVSGRRVLITGAGGSIGSEIARQVASCAPSELYLLDHDETHLHDAIATLPSGAVQLLVDIRSAQAVLNVFETYRPELVFHAAAHKHVPILESHPCEAVQTNVAGTRNVVAAATATEVDRLVFISTDKAVRPSSVMGATKWLGEQIVLGAQGHQGRYCAVRFGNVLGSRGSVVPSFLRQIAAGGPVTITDPRMTRFFMSIEEAVQLVLQAASMAEGGEIFMLEMGEPVRIMDLAQRMIRLAGRRVGTDVEVRVTGIRPGEKLAEELSAPDEVAEPTAHPSVIRLSPIPLSPDSLALGLRWLGELTAQGREDRVKSTLFSLANGTLADADQSLQNVDVDAKAHVIDLTEESTWSRSNT